MLRDSLFVGDPYADAVIQEIEKQGQPAREQLELGLRSGLASLENPPPAVAAFLRELENPPANIDQSLLAKGDTSSLSIPPFWLYMSLLLGSVWSGYEIRRVSQILSGTNNLAAATGRRLDETNLWRRNVSGPGSMNLGASGYVDTAQVRLLHARVRSALIRQGIKADIDCVPLNQADMFSTFMDFTYRPFAALGRIGFALTEQEEIDLYKYWHSICHMLGVDPQLYLSVNNHKEAEEWLSAYAELGGIGIDDNVIKLRAALVEFASKELNNLVRPDWSGEPVAVINALIRRLVGDERADKADVDQSDFVAAIDIFAYLEVSNREVYRASSDAWAAYVERNYAQFYYATAQVQGETTYQHNISAPPVAGRTPQTQVPAA